MNIFYRNNNAELYKLFHISVTCQREKERRHLLEKYVVQYTQQETCQRHHISNKYDHQNLVIALLSFLSPTIFKNSKQSERIHSMS